MKRSETRLGLAKRDCMDIKRAYRGIKREAQCAKAELQSFEETTKESITNCAERTGLLKDAVITRVRPIIGYNDITDTDTDNRYRYRYDLII